jgi:transposase
MTQKERDLLVTLKKTKNKLITQQEAATELDVSTRHVRRLVNGLRKGGDKSVIHGLKGKPSNRGIEEETREKAVRILSAEPYHGFGPTLASEYLRDKHGIEVSKETVRQWMIGAKLWRARQARVEQVHLWRPRRSQWGELVQWDTSEHDWLEGRGEKLYLIAMIDDATSRLLARFALHDTTAENMAVLELYVRRNGRPLAFYTDKASLFQTAGKTKRGQQREGKDRPEMPPTQIGRALRELGITWIGAHSPQAKGRVERGFATAQDRLVKGLRVAGAGTLEQANRYLETEFLRWWEQRLTVQPAASADAHRPLEKQHDLAAILSHVESRQVQNDYTIALDGKVYGIERADICSGLRGADVRVEQRRDGTIAIRFQDKYLRHSECERAQQANRPSQAARSARSRKGPNAGGKSQWMKGFQMNDGPSLQEAIQIANATS